MQHKLIEKRYLVTFILITSLFALWGFANDITNPMVAAFQTVMELSAFEASWIQLAFYGGYAQWLYLQHCSSVNTAIRAVSF